MLQGKILLPGRKKMLYIGVRGGGAGGAAAPPVAKIFGQNTCDSGKSTWDKIFD